MTSWSYFMCLHALCNEVLFFSRFHFKMQCFCRCYYHQISSQESSKSHVLIFSLHVFCPMCLTRRTENSRKVSSSTSHEFACDGFSMQLWSMHRVCQLCQNSSRCLVPLLRLSSACLAVESSLH